MLTEKEKAARLRLVQQAARHVLHAFAEATDVAPVFRATTIFPESARDVAGLSASEQGWRMQLSWAWRQAGYLHGEVRGRGFRKHTEYVLTPLGRAALSQIAADPVLASFYVSSKRSSAQNQGGNADWFRPPALRESDSDNVTLDGDVDGPQTDEGGDEDAGAEDDAGEIEEEDAPSGASDERDRQLAIFMGRATDVLESMNERLGAFGQRLDVFDKRMSALESVVVSEVKAQTDVVLDAAAKLEQMKTFATRDDVAGIAAELVAAMSSMRWKPAEGEIVTPEMVQTLSELVAYLSGRVDAVLQETTTNGAATARVMDALQNVSESLMSVRASIATMSKAGSSEDLAASVKKDVGDILKRLSTGLELTLPTGETMDLLQARLDKLAAAAKGTTDAVETYQENFVAFVEQNRDLSRRVQETLFKTAESVDSFMDDAKYVAGELLNLATEYTVLRGGKAEDTAKAMIPHAENMVIAREALKNRMTALGGGLLRMNIDGARRVDPLVVPTSIAKVEAVVAGEPKAEGGLK